MMNFDLMNSNTLKSRIKNCFSQTELETIVTDLEKEIEESTVAHERMILQTEVKQLALNCAKLENRVPKQQTSDLVTINTHNSGQINQSNLDSKHFEQETLDLKSVQVECTIANKEQEDKSSNGNLAENKHEHQKHDPRQPLLIENHSDEVQVRIDEMEKEVKKLNERIETMRRQIDTKTNLLEVGKERLSIVKAVNESMQNKRLDCLACLIVVAVVAAVISLFIWEVKNKS